MTLPTASAQTKKTSGPPMSERQKLDPSKMDVYKALPEIAEDGVTDMKDASEKVASAAAHAIDMLKATYANAARGAMSYNVKVFEIARGNMSAALDHFNEISAVKSLPEFIELSTANMRKQVELFSAQTRDLLGLGRKVLAETAEPIKSAFKKFD